MSERWPGGIVRSTPVTPTGPLQNGTAPGIWTMEQAAYWTKQGLWPTAGNFLAVEDVFSTWLYTGNGSTQTITNGINLSGQGGMVWVKNRNSTQLNWTFNSAIGATQPLSTNSTDSAATNIANYFGAANLCVFNNNGFSFASQAQLTTSPNTYASWTFRKAPKFFDVVTYTGNGASDPTRSISHNLGVKPGVIIVKATSATGNWYTIAFDGTNYKRSSAASDFAINLTNSAAGSLFGGTSYLSATDFQLGAIVPDIDTTPSQRDKVNANGVTYVAYLFAHDTTSTGIIQCGSYVRTGSSVSVNLGWEPQWVLVKKATDINGFGGSNWAIADNMRGFDVTSWSRLNPNTANAETTGVSGLSPNATGFTVTNASGQADSGETYIYIAIRRGPMRTPTSGTSVFSPVARTGTGSVTTVNAGFAPDLHISFDRNANAYPAFYDRLRGVFKSLKSNSTAAEVSDTTSLAAFNNTNSEVWNDTTNGSINFSGWNYANWIFRRAPSFFDVVCYTGTGNGVVQSVNHNLGVAPEMVIMKERTTAFYSWITWTTALNLSSTYGLLALNSNSGVGFSSNNLNSTAPTSTVVSVSADGNASGKNYVLYLFASCPGVSKVGSYTGTGTTQTINCGFTTGARFVLIKRTDSTGDWYVWDSARGIVAGDDPYLLLNSTAAEVTNTDYVDTDNSGFQISSTAPAAINANGGTFIYLAIS